MPATKTTKAAPAHPPVATMVVAAIKALKDRKGSSLIAIKKYIAANFKCDVAKLAPFIRRFLKSAVEKGTLKQVKGTGASGSFKMGQEEKPKKKVVKKPKAAKPKKAKTPKKAAKKTAEKKVVKKTPKKADKPKKAKKTPTRKAAAKKPKATPKKARSAKPKVAKPKVKKAAPKKK